MKEGLPQRISIQPGTNLKLKEKDLVMILSVRVKWERVEQRVRKANEDVKEMDLFFSGSVFAALVNAHYFLTHTVSEFSTLSDLDDNSQRVGKKKKAT